MLLMAKLLIKYFSTPVALVYFDKLLDVGQRVGLAVSVGPTVSAALASKLAGACEGQEALRSAEALDDVGMQRLAAQVEEPPPEAQVLARAVVLALGDPHEQGQVGGQRVGLPGLLGTLERLDSPRLRRCRRELRLVCYCL